MQMAAEDGGGRSVSQPPTNPKLYHIVHMDKLPLIVADGQLLCDAVIAQRAGGGTTIGMGHIKTRRLTHECVAALRQARLEPSIGAFHVSRPGRPALALDLMEPFRPLIGDSVAVAAFNRGELTEGHFIRTASGCMLTDAGRRAFFSVWGRRMDTEIMHPVFKYRLSYRRMLVLHARMIAAWLLGEVPSLSFLTTR